ncbi:mechanosensitive ion channel [Bizionia argentinensis JUB59]|uniref:Mechanosensitive ion channel n=1 Tax=Bizionia argentinensis JUB59 TaxID=1046627 RepID=G2EF31_9FLAO|nr:mechanosensitive ion channel domain-containing protein [Bizionia argentinensis]EGV42976.1 mechanosensitive ion channel [Bizionia argentinensis JUB59]
MQNNFEDVVKQSGVWETIVDFLNLGFEFGSGEETIKVSVGLVLLVVVIFIATSIILNFLKRLYAKRLPKEDKAKFNTVFSFSRWFIYLIVVLVVFDSVGVNVTAIFAASAALLIGVGLALQTLFQDIISGVFILVDQSLQVGDVIELEGKVGRVEEIKLRTTRAVTIDNRVLVIPNHLYLTKCLYNWTQNGNKTRESISLGVAHSSDVKLVERLLTEAANSHDDVLEKDSTIVLITDFEYNAIRFKLIFSVLDSFREQFIKSDIRYEIDRLFKENNITIPFPQRDIHIIEKQE